MLFPLPRCLLDEIARGQGCRIYFQSFESHHVTLAEHCTYLNFPLTSATLVKYRTTFSSVWMNLSPMRSASMPFGSSSGENAIESDRGASLFGVKNLLERLRLGIPSKESITVFAARRVGGICRAKSAYNCATPSIYASNKGMPRPHRETD